MKSVICTLENLEKSNRQRVKLSDNLTAISSTHIILTLIRHNTLIIDYHCSINIIKQIILLVWQIMTTVNESENGVCNSSIDRGTESTSSAQISGLGAAFTGFVGTLKQCQIFLSFLTCAIARSRYRWLSAS